MFDEILVPVDRSVLAEHILPHTIIMAQAYNSKVTLVSILDPAAGSSADRPTDPFDWQIYRGEAEVYLKNLTCGLEASGVAVQAIVLDGKASDQVVLQSNSMGTGLIMLSSHGQGGVSSWNSSRVVMKIIEQAHTSVMIIRPFLAPESSRASMHYRRILVPLDGSKRAEYGLAVAAQFARKHGAELMIAHVVKPPELPHRTPLVLQDRALVRKVVERNRIEGSEYLNALKDSLDCHVESRLVVSKSVTEALHTVVEQEEIDLVILNAHGMSGNPRWPYGNVAVNFLAYSTVPLLIVQDFNRAQLLQSNESIHVNEQWSQQRLIANASSLRYKETSA